MDSGEFRREYNGSVIVCKQLQAWRNTMSSGNTESITLNLPNMRVKGLLQPKVEPNNEYNYAKDHLNDIASLLGSVTPKPDKGHLALTTFRNTKRPFFLLFFIKIRPK